VDLSIPRGSRIALIGRTGAGKTTFADLLMGLLRPSEGAILIDGTPLSPHNEQAWRRSVAHVPQSIFLADATIARNIAFTAREETIDLDRVTEAARIAQLDDFVSSLPEGLDTRVGERGIRLSGGQRQRLGIARALYKDAQLLVLDEATNALDAETEAALMRALIDEVGDERTILLISHRPSTLAYCDLVIRLDNGMVTECVEAASPPIGGRARGRPA
jgi:ATP-binding cassette subfamily B protein